MEKHRLSVPPIIIAILVLPLLYVGSYLALASHTVNSGLVLDGVTIGFCNAEYRWGGPWTNRLFWPLEKIDRWARPGFWTRKAPP